MILCEIKDFTNINMLVRIKVMVHSVPVVVKMIRFQNLMIGMKLFMLRKVNIMVIRIRNVPHTLMIPDNACGIPVLPERIRMVPLRPD